MSATKPVIDRDDPLPLYVQLKQALVREIQANRLRPGDQLPTEPVIERRYRVSRSTIRQALSQLVAEGVVERVQGKGTFVALPRIHHVPLLTSFTENMRAQGYVPSRRVLTSAVHDAPADVAVRLALADTDRRCRFMRRLLLADTEPVGVAETWLPTAVLPGHDELFDPTRLEKGSLYDLLQAPPFELVLHRGVETVVPAVADDRYAELLACRAGTPLLIVDRLTYSLQEQPVEYTHMAFAGDRYEYRVEMFRPGVTGSQAERPS